MKTAMTPKAFVEALYINVLGREPDPNGLEALTQAIHETGDPTLVLQAMLDSPEYKERTQLDSARQEMAIQALEQLGRNPHIVDVGAQSLGVDTHPYSSLLSLAPCTLIGFDPLEHRILEREATERSHQCTLLPYAVADGNDHTLYINNEDGTSSLFPLNESFNKHFNHLSTLHTVSTRKVHTTRLDDILDSRPIDLLKLDIQGAELMALQGAVKHLSSTAVVHCEIEFKPLYLGQPLFQEIYSFLEIHGFEMIDILPSGLYHYIVPSGRSTSDRLLWADVVFFKHDATHEMLAAQSLIAAAMYGKLTLAEHLLLKSTR